MNMKRLFAVMLFSATFAVGITGSGLIAAQGATQPTFENVTMAYAPALASAENDPGFTAAILKAESWGGGNIGDGGTTVIEGTRDKWIPIVAPALRIRTASMLRNSRMPLSKSGNTGKDFGFSTLIKTEPD